MAPSRSNNSKTKLKNKYRRNLSSQKKISRGSQARKKTQKKKKFNLLLKTSVIKPTDNERSMPNTADLYGDRDGQRVEDSDDDFLSHCNIRSSRLKMGNKHVTSSRHRKSDDVLTK
ncbi:hypothetical protein Fot_15587 [Forsythia ovata]|uniref:Uncharacterized protein n=1 Tax=Forsythia ovata TaxID=205694 RepID=A0ABD1W9L9_9LAMI